MEKEFLTREEAAVLLKELTGSGSPSWLSALAVRGGGPVYYKLGPKRVGYRKADLEEWVASRIVRQPSKVPTRRARQSNTRLSASAAAIIPAE
jgi:predicted DNA-binding transcriptional regulator AlpA